MKLGQKIRGLRQEREWTQLDLALRSGIDRTTLASIETGKVKNPSAETFIKLARAFNIRPEELYQAAGYIKNAKTAYWSHKNSAEELLERARIALPATVPIYEDFPFHAGEAVEPMDYIAIIRDRAKGKNLEGYYVHGNCLEPHIKDGDIIIVDREGQIDNGDIIACLIGDELHVARLRKTANEAYLEDNHRRTKIEEAQVVAPVIEVRRRLK